MPPLLCRYCLLLPTWHTTRPLSELYIRYHHEGFFCTIAAGSSCMLLPSSRDAGAPQAHGHHCWWTGLCQRKGHLRPGWGNPPTEGLIKNILAACKGGYTGNLAFSPDFDQLLLACVSDTTADSNTNTLLTINTTDYTPISLRQDSGPGFNFPSALQSGPDGLIYVGGSFSPNATTLAASQYTTTVAVYNASNGYTRTVSELNAAKVAFSMRSLDIGQDEETLFFTGRNAPTPFTVDASNLTAGGCLVCWRVLMAI